MAVSIHVWVYKKFILALMPTEPESAVPLPRSSQHPQTSSRGPLALCAVRCPALTTANVLRSGGAKHSTQTVCLCCQAPFVFWRAMLSLALNVVAGTLCPLRYAPMLCAYAHATPSPVY
eukprot:1961074-Rhodomonas_salina.2